MMTSNIVKDYGQFAGKVEISLAGDSERSMIIGQWQSAGNEGGWNVGND
jgi:hypothetical protein